MRPVDLPAAVQRCAACRSRSRGAGRCRRRPAPRRSPSRTRTSRWRRSGRSAPGSSRPGIERQMGDEDDGHREAAKEVQPRVARAAPESYPTYRPMLARSLPSRAAARGLAASIVPPPVDDPATRLAQMERSRKRAGCVTVVKARDIPGGAMAHEGRGMGAGGEHGVRQRWGRQPSCIPGRRQGPGPSCWRCAGGFDAGARRRPLPGSASRRPAPAAGLRPRPASPR